MPIWHDFLQYFLNSFSLSSLFSLPKGHDSLIDTKTQLLCPIANCRISWYFTENIVHKLIQDIEYFNNLT